MPLVADDHDRLIGLERDVQHLLGQSRTIQATLHNLLATMMSDHSAAIKALSESHQKKVGIWWTVGWMFTVLLIIFGALGWLLEHNVQIVVKP